MLDRFTLPVPDVGDRVIDWAGFCKNRGVVALAKTSWLFVDISSRLDILHEYRRQRVSLCCVGWTESMT